MTIGFGMAEPVLNQANYAWYQTRYHRAIPKKAESKWWLDNLYTQVVPPEPLTPSIIVAYIVPDTGVVGSTFTVSRTATGYPSPTWTYQWQLNGINIDGATSQSYLSTSVGDLTCVVTATNTEGSDSLETAIAIITEEPPTGGGGDGSIGDMIIGSTFEVA